LIRSSSVCEKNGIFTVELLQIFSEIKHLLYIDVNDNKNVGKIQKKCQKAIQDICYLTFRRSEYKVTTGEPVLYTPMKRSNSSS